MNTHDLSSLREEHPRFRYRAYKWSLVDHTLTIDFDFQIDPDIYFSPHLVIDHIPEGQLDTRVVDNLVFHIGLIEMLSYWKATCSPRIVVEAGLLTDEQIKWWHHLILSGMGEYFYRNQIDFTADDFLTLESTGISVEAVGSVSGREGILVPIGGGKDSIAALDILKDKQVTLFAVNPTPAISRTMEIAGRAQIIVHRSIDPRLIELNKEGFLNGHTPLSAMLAFVSVLTAYLFDHSLIALSNEGSANEGNVTYFDTDINHQYSKSFDFEQRFDTYCRQHLVENVRYFSVLRPLNEVQIARVFAAHTKYDAVFSSCNRNNQAGTWCCRCPKCVSTYLLLSGFLSPERLQTIFIDNPLTLAENADYLEQMVRPELTKPFECVPTYNEMRAAVKNLVTIYRRRKMSLPTLLTNDELLTFDSPSFDQLLIDWQPEHLIPPSIEPLVRRAARQTPALNEKRVLILGFGVEGVAAYQYVKNHFSPAEMGIADKQSRNQLNQTAQEALANEDGLSLYFGENYLEALTDYDVIIKSPGIALNLIPSDCQLKTITPTQLFFSLCPARIVGVTGTKGKSTTASLIWHLLSTNGISSRLMGNIGTAALTQLDAISPDEIVVMELSSHQLAEMTESPEIAVLLNIYQEHLDYYSGMDEYVAAKANIVRYQRPQDVLVYDDENEYVRGVASLSQAILIPFSDNQPSNKGQLQGSFNQKNSTAATLVAQQFGLTDDQIKTAILTFKPLSHRLETVCIKNEITFVDDTLATLPEATMAAIESFQGRVDTIILGGSERHQHFDELVKAVASSSIRNVILFPDTGVRIKAGFDALKSDSELHFFEVDQMESAVQLAMEHTRPGSVCLLSPASPSFSGFKNYVDKSEQYKAAIQQYSKES